MVKEVWTTVCDSEFHHEREALAWLRRRLPDRRPYHVWTNFEFTTFDGRLYEVDALAITDNGFHLIEIKSYSGELAGDSGSWELTSSKGKFRQLDNPRFLANKKAKALKGLIEAAPAFKKYKGSVPYLEECVFLSDPDLVCRLPAQGRHNIFGRDTDAELLAKRASLGGQSLAGIVDHLTGLGPVPNGRTRHRIKPQLVTQLVKAIDQVGIRESIRRKEVGDYLLSGLLEDVAGDTTDGVAYQDFLGQHRSLTNLQRRIRIYPLELNATRERRDVARRAAQREFELLQPLDHPGILHPLNHTANERGPALFFDYSPDEVPLAAFLADPAQRTLSVEGRLALIRQIAEAVNFANSKGVFHRSLSPSAVWVSGPDEDQGDPRVRVTNWHTGARLADGSTSTLAVGTVHTHVKALAAGDAGVFQAPEFARPGARPRSLDVFSLGALALFILTGERPAPSAKQLRTILRKVGHLDPTTVADVVAKDLAEVVIWATKADPAKRLNSGQEFLSFLDIAEESWRGENDPADDEVLPSEARRGDLLGGDRFKVVHRLGKGSTAQALLVIDNSDDARLCVLKVAHDVDHNYRIRSEAKALGDLQHQAIVPLLESSLELSGYAAILIGYAGPKIDPARLELKEARTLASRLTGGSVGVELAQRWGADLLDALRYLEETGRAHRDIKPDNIGVAPRGENKELHLVLFDFSLSNAPLDALEAGTAGYIDPFLEERERWDQAAERYSAVVTLFELTTGKKPCYGDGTAEPAMISDPATVESAMFDAAVASGLVDFFTKALQRDSADRFDTAEEMLRDWNKAFQTAAEPSTPASDSGEPSWPENLSETTELARLPLSRRAVSALERAEILTVADLLALPPMKLRSLTGVGKATRKEISEARDQIEARGIRAITRVNDRENDDDPLIRLARTAVPVLGRGNAQTQVKLARILVGLEPDRDPWVSQNQLSDWLGISRGEVCQFINALRQRWLKQGDVTQLRDQVRIDMATLQVASVDQVGALLAVTHGSLTRSARGLVRLATLAEQARKSQGWIVSRHHDEVFLAAQSDDEEAATAQDLVNYAVEVAHKAEELLAAQSVVARPLLLENLHRIARPDAMAALPDAHLADLAADLCGDAAVNSRLELYRRGLVAKDALGGARRTLLTTGDPLKVEDLASKIAARFPESTVVLPQRPALDRVLQEAGVELVWCDERGAYVSPQHTPTASSRAVVSCSRYPTDRTVSIPPVEIDNAAEFDHLLRHSRYNDGRVFVLITDAVELAKAETQLARVANLTVSVDEWLVDQLQELTAARKPTWATLAAADSRGEAGPDWGKLRQVVDLALESFSQRLLATEGTVLLTNLGLLARYDRLNLLAECREALLDGGHKLQALWWLIPSTVGGGAPLLDGRAVPVISPNEWCQIPPDWLRNAHQGSPVS